MRTSFIVQIKKINGRQGLLAVKRASPTLIMGAQVDGTPLSLFHLSLTTYKWMECGHRCVSGVGGLLSRLNPVSTHPFPFCLLQPRHGHQCSATMVSKPLESTVMEKGRNLNPYMKESCPQTHHVCPEALCVKEINFVYVSKLRISCHSRLAHLQ